jgi:hypothetical protein
VQVPILYSVNDGNFIRLAHMNYSANLFFTYVLSMLLIHVLI